MYTKILCIYLTRIKISSENHQTLMITNQKIFTFTTREFDGISSSSREKISTSIDIVSFGEAQRVPSSDSSFTLQTPYTSALNVRRRDRLDVIHSLPPPCAGWSVDTNTGPNSQYLYALNLRNPQQYLNLEAFRNERAETSHTLVQNDRLNCNNPSPNTAFSPYSTAS